MKRKELIEISESNDLSFSLAQLEPYKKSIYTYFKGYYGEEPILMVTAVFNAVQYGKIVPESKFHEAVFHWCNESDFSFDELDEETIFANSLYLKDLIQ